MSKSKRNIVDPDEIITTYGADTARWFMLSDSPPERDVIWTEERVQGSSRFVQRLWRVVNDAMPTSPRSAPAPKPDVIRGCRRWRSARPPMARSTRCRTASSGCISMSASPISASSPIRSPTRIGGNEATLAPDLAWAIKEAASVLVVLVSPMMPHLAEECWAALGHDTLVSQAGWPQVEPALLVEDTVTLPVQVNGKKRAEITVARAAVQCGN